MYIYIYIYNRNKFQDIIQFYIFIKLNSVITLYILTTKRIIKH